MAASALSEVCVCSLVILTYVEMPAPSSPLKWSIYSYVVGVSVSGPSVRARDRLNCRL